MFQRSSVLYTYCSSVGTVKSTILTTSTRSITAFMGSNRVQAYIFQAFSLQLLKDSALLLLPRISSAHLKILGLGGWCLLIRGYFCAV